MATLRRREGQRSQRKKKPGEEPVLTFTRIGDESEWSDEDDAPDQKSITQPNTRGKGDRHKTKTTKQVQPPPARRPNDSTFLGRSRSVDLNLSGKSVQFAEDTLNISEDGGRSYTSIVRKPKHRISLNRTGTGRHEIELSSRRPKERLQKRLENLSVRGSQSVLKSSRRAKKTSPIASTSKFQPSKHSPVLKLPGGKLRKRNSSERRRSSEHDIANRSHGFQKLIRSIDPIDDIYNDGWYFNMEIVGIPSPRVFKHPRRRCSDCDKELSVKYYKTHKRIHDSRPLPQCDQCNKSYANEATLKVHRESIHENIRNYKCNTCEKRYYARSAKEIHELSVHQHKIFGCAECGRTYRHRSSIRSHSRSAHLDEKPWECDLCDKRFQYQCLLKRHLKVHDGSRANQTRSARIRCSTCNKDFASTYLKAHKIRMHEDITDVMARLGRNDTDTLRSTSSTAKRRKGKENVPEVEISPPRTRRVEDLSPPKKVKNSSPPKNIKDLSPPKKIKNSSPPKTAKDSSPPKKVKNSSPPKKVKDLSPPKKVKNSSPPKKVKDPPPPRKVKSSKAWKVTGAVSVFTNTRSRNKNVSPPKASPPRPKATAAIAISKETEQVTPKKAIGPQPSTSRTSLSLIPRLIDQSYSKARKEQGQGIPKKLIGPQPSTSRQNQSYLPTPDPQPSTSRKSYLPTPDPQPSTSRQSRPSMPRIDELSFRKASYSINTSRQHKSFRRTSDWRAVSPEWRY